MTQLFLNVLNYTVLSRISPVTDPSATPVADKFCNIWIADLWLKKLVWRPNRSQKMFFINFCYIIRRRRGLKLNALCALSRERTTNSRRNGLYFSRPSISLFHTMIWVIVFISLSFIYNLVRRFPPIATNTVRFYQPG